MELMGEERGTEKPGITEKRAGEAFKDGQAPHRALAPLMKMMAIM
jgi:hypothetical protein